MNIYSIEDLKNKDFDDEEINDVSNTLIYSLIIGMFNHIGIKKSNNYIIRKCKYSENWFDKFEWTSDQFKSYEQILEKIFYNLCINLYRFSPSKCENSAYDFLMKYGLSIKEN